VGGDYYDFVELGPRKLAVLVGDVSGKGIQAAFYMTLTKGFVKALCRADPSPASVLRRLNELFLESAPRGVFITMVYGVIDLEEGTFTHARAGHNPVFHTSARHGSTQILKPFGLAIGLTGGPAFDASLVEETVKLEVGDTLVLYTDGITESVNRRRAQYGEERLEARLKRLGASSAGDAIRVIAEDVHAFIGGVGQQDDMTLVVLRIGSLAAPRAGMGGLREEPMSTSA
jgi:phosphoserine phosphatase RsbU/P